MAKDNRQILRGIRIPVELKNEKPDKEGVLHKRGSLTFKDGMEDELAQHFDQERLDQLVAMGSISGNWKAMKKAAAAK